MALLGLVVDLCGVYAICEIYIPRVTVMRHIRPPGYAVVSAWFYIGPALPSAASEP
jgi:hypothetical protein